MARSHQLPVPPYFHHIASPRPRNGGAHTGNESASDHINTPSTTQIGRLSYLFLVFDQASAAMAKGEVMIAARDGHELPPGVGLDSNGEPTVDPQAILDGGTMLPFGGYKGSAIAMMIELLAGGLIGQGFSFEAGERDNKDGGPPRGGELMLAMDPEKFRDAAGWLDHSESFFDQLLTLEGTRLPGSRRYRNRESTPRDGVWVPEALHKKIEMLCST